MRTNRVISYNRIIGILGVSAILSTSIVGLNIAADEWNYPDSAAYAIDSSKTEPLPHSRAEMRDMYDCETDDDCEEKYPNLAEFVDRQ